MTDKISFVDKIKNIEDKITTIKDTNGKTLANDDLVSELRQKVRNIEKNIDEITTRDRCLKLGIVGRVKAGKSSFLNALLFDGQQILPKAATPMTAALPKIGYSENPEAKIVFYKDYDWQEIKTYANEYKKRIEEECNRRIEAQKKAQFQISIEKGKRFIKKYLSAPDTQQYNSPYDSSLDSEQIDYKKLREDVEKNFGKTLPEKLRSCAELVSMAERISVREMLDSEKIIPGDPTSSPDEFLRSLTDYVGANGRYTPLVNYIELKVNIPSLKGFEIVDTPGLNDPIVSRGRKTKEFLIECDATFVLSNVSQFISQDDIKLLSSDLGQAGVKEAYLIGTMLDSGLLQYPDKNANFLDAYAKSIYTYKEHARTSLNAASSKSDIITKLAQRGKVEFVSSLMHSIAKKKESGESLNSDEKFVVDRLYQRFRYLHDLLKTATDYYDLAGIKEIKENIVAELRTKKEQIIAERIVSFEKSQSSELLLLLENINISAQRDMQTLLCSDFENLTSKLEFLDKKLDSIREAIFNIFVNEGIKFEKYVQKLKLDVQSLAEDHRHIEVEKDSYTSKSTSGWIWKTHTTTTITTYKANKANVITNIEKFFAEAMGHINNELDKIFNKSDLSAKIKQTVIGAFELSDTEFDESEVLGPIELLLNQITIHRVDFAPMEDVIRDITQQFPGEVENEHISKLRMVQIEQQNKILKGIATRLDTIATEANRKMKEQAAVFVDDIKKKVGDRIDKIRAQLDNREQELERYKELISTVARLKTDLRAL